MGYMKTSKILSFLIVTALLVSSCGGDDPASSDDPDPPSLPEFSNIEADISYFEQNAPSKAANNNFNNAKNYALGLSGVSTLSQSYLAFLSSANNTEAEYNNGQWTWEYSYGYQGQSATVKLVAQETSGMMNWGMFLSVDDGAGNSFEDYKIFEGSVATDGSSGTWTFNSLNSDGTTEVPVLETTWEKFSDTNVEINTDIYENGTDQVLNYTYVRDGSVYDMTYTSNDTNNSIYIHWETDARTGYYQIGDDASNRLCWDDGLADVDCSSLGY